MSLLLSLLGDGDMVDFGGSGLISRILAIRPSLISIEEGISLRGESRTARGPSFGTIPLLVTPFLASVTLDRSSTLVDWKSSHLSGYCGWWVRSWGSGNYWRRNIGRLGRSIGSRRRKVAFSPFISHSILKTI